MSRFTYLSNGVGVIHGFPMSTDTGYRMPADALKTALTDVETCIKTHRCPSLIAIIADYYQTDSHKTLLANGFRRVFRFPSAHNCKAENLTFWVKIDRGVKVGEVDDRYAKGAFPVNCSVSDKVGAQSRLTVTTKRTDGFKKVKGSQVRYRIDGRLILKDKVAKPAR